MGPLRDQLDFWDMNFHESKLLHQLYVQTVLEGEKKPILVIALLISRLGNFVTNLNTRQKSIEIVL